MRPNHPTLALTEWTSCEVAAGMLARPDPCAIIA